MERQGYLPPALTPMDVEMGAAEMQLSTFGVLRESFKSGALESFGLGTAIRDFAIPEGDVSEGRSPFRDALAMNPLTAPYELGRRAFQSMNPPSKRLSQEEYQQGPFFRKDIAWDDKMTEDRAAALASWYDARKVRETRLAQTPGWATQLAGGFLGQALDPINYVPFLGVAAKGVAAARFGVVTGRALTGAADAALNTAAFGLATAPIREQFGDEVSFERIALDVAMSAAIGAAFGTVGGALEGRSIRRQQAALRNVTETHAAINDAVGTLLTEGEVRLRPETVGGLAKMAEPEAAVEAVRAAEGIGPAAFQTARGSTYEFHEDGTSTRNKAARADPGHEGQEGPQPRTDATYFVAAQDLSRLGTPQGEWRVIDHGDGTISIATRNAEGAWGIAPSSRNVPVSKTPTVGAAPVELWKPETVNGARAYSRVHYGNEIVSVEARAPAPSVRPKADLTVPPPEAPNPDLQIAAQNVSKPTRTAKEMGEEFRIDPESGDFDELDDIASLEAQGRLPAEEKAKLDRATEILQRSKVYADALKQAAICGMN